MRNTFDRITPPPPPPQDLVQTGNSAATKNGRGGLMKARYLHASLLGLTLILFVAPIFIFLLSGGIPGAAAQNLPEIAALGDDTYTEGDVAYFYLVHDRVEQPMKVSVTFSQTGSYMKPGDVGRKTVTLDVYPFRQTEIRIHTVDDNQDESDGSITMTINPGSGYTVGEDHPSSTVYVKDNDEPSISVRAGSAIREGRSATFILTARPTPASPLEVTVNVADPDDFAASGQAGSRVATIGTNGRGTLSVATIADGIDEDDGSITATIVKGSGYTVGSPDSGSVIVTDGGDPTPRISIAAGSDIEEGDTATFTLSASPAPTSPLEVAVNVADPGDFAASGQAGSRVATIGTNGRGTLSVATEDDGVENEDGAITTTVVNGSGYTVGSRARASVAVADGGDPTPRISISAGPNINEGGTATFTLTANPAPDSALEVTVNVSENGDFGAGAQIGAQFVSIGTDGRGFLSVTTANDVREEADGSITASLGAGSGYVLAPPTSATVRVRDLGGIKVSVAPVGSTVIEGDLATFRFTASQTPVSAINVNLRLTVSGDFVAGSQSWTDLVIIGADSVATLEIQTDDDGVDERNGSITATVVSGGGDYAIGRPASATIQINDNDAANSNSLVVSVGDAEIRENPRAGTPSIKFPVTLNKPADEWVVVTYETRETPSAFSPATGNQDYESVSGGVVFLPGETLKYAPVFVYDDDDAEEDETFEVVLTRIMGRAEIYTGVATGTIRSDPYDAERGVTEITLSVQPAVVEGQSFSFTLTAMPPPEDDLPVEITVTDGYEGDTSDFIATDREGSHTVIYHGDASLIWTLPEGENYTRQTFTIPTVNDRTDEADGPVFVEVLAPADESYLSQSPYREAVIVYDNDGGAPQMPVISVSDGDGGQPATELSGRVQFSVELDRPVHPDGKVTTHYAVHSGTAQPGQDYVLDYGRLEFLGGDDHKFVEIQIIDDDVTEGVETFKLKLSHPEGATIGDAEGIAIIEASD